MKKFLYEIFTADTDSTSYKKVTLNFLLASIAPIVLFFNTHAAAAAKSLHNW